MYFHILCCWSWKMFGAGETQAVCITQTFIWYIKLIFLHLLQIFFSFLMITSTHCNRCVMSCLPDGCCQLTEASIRGGGCPQDVKGCKSIAWGQWSRTISSGGCPQVVGGCKSIAWGQWSRTISSGGCPQDVGVDDKYELVQAWWNQHVAGNAHVMSQTFVIHTKCG